MATQKAFALTEHVLKSERRSKELARELEERDGELLRLRRQVEILAEVSCPRPSRVVLERQALVTVNYRVDGNDLLTTNSNKLPQ